MYTYKCASCCDATKKIKKGEKIPLYCGERMLRIKESDYVHDMECACSLCK